VPVYSISNRSCARLEAESFFRFFAYGRELIYNNGSLVEILTTAAFHQTNNPVLVCTVSAHKVVMTG
jgi:hypothetical protein